MREEDSVAGRLHKDFRSGNPNEELGILLLKGVAAVATVPRPEDVGIDAIATLLREDANDMLIAENSFYVQFKSAADRTVKYVAHEVHWLHGLKLPFFIGSIRKADATIDLYAAHRLSQVLIENQYDEIELVLNPENDVHFGLNPKTEDVSEKSRRVDVGPPLLRWSINDIANRGAMNQVYSCLKTYLEAEQKNIDFRGIRYYEAISWETGKQPRCNEAACLMHGLSDAALAPVLRAMSPHLLAIKSLA